MKLLKKLAKADSERRKALKEFRKWHEIWVLCMTELQCFESMEALTADMEYLFNKDSPFNDPRVTENKRDTIINQAELMQQREIINRIKNKK